MTRRTEDSTYEQRTVHDCRRQTTILINVVFLDSYVFCVSFSLQVDGIGQPFSPVIKSWFFDKMHRLQMERALFYDNITLRTRLLDFRQLQETLVGMERYGNVDSRGPFEQQRRPLRHENCRSADTGCISSKRLLRCTWRRAIKIASWKNETFPPKRQNGNIIIHALKMPRVLGERKILLTRRWSPHTRGIIQYYVEPSKPFYRLRISSLEFWRLFFLNSKRLSTYAFK